MKRLFILILFMAAPVVAQNTSDVVVHLDNSYAGGPVVWQILPPQGAVAVSNSSYLNSIALIEIRNLAQGWTYGIRVTRLDGTGPLCTNVTINGAEQNVTSALLGNACGGGGGGGGPQIQTNETPNQSQSLIDFQNATETPTGKQVAALNPSGGIEHLVLAHTQPSTGGSALIGDIIALQIGQTICSDSTVHLTNCTPAIPAIPHAGASYTILSTDRGNIIGRSNGGAMTDSIAAPGTSGFELGFYVGIKNFGSGSITLSSVGSVFNDGTGASASVTIPSQAYAYLYDTGTAYWVNISSSGGGGGNVTCSQLPALTGAVTTSAGSCATSLTNPDKTCMMQFGSDGAAAALATTDYFPQMSVCYSKYGGTVDTVIVMADAGASTVKVGFDVNGAYTDISPTLTPATVSGIADKVACANTGGTVITIKGTSVTCSALSSTSIAAGQYLETSAGTADGTTKRLSIAVTWQ